MATIAGEYLRKGRPVYVEGRIRTNKWQDKDGQDRYTTEIVATEMKLLGSREGLGDAPPTRAAEPAPAQGSAETSKPPAGFDDMDDDIPF